jgi:hypothetical protein
VNIAKLPELAFRAESDQVEAYPAFLK